MLSENTMKSGCCVCCELTLTINNISYLCFEWQFEQITRRCDENLALQFKVKTYNESWHFSTDDVSDFVSGFA